MATGRAEAAVGKVACAAWVQRRNDEGPGPRLFVAFGRGATAASPHLLDLVAFDARTSVLDAEPLARVMVGEEGADAPRAIAVHPGGRELVCSTAKGCRLFEMVYKEFGIHLISREASLLQSVGPQKCLAFSTDGAKFAIGGEDGHLRLFHWPSLSVILDEPKAHKSFHDMDIRGNRDGDLCAVDVKKMEVSHWSKKVHLGSPITSIEFCPTESAVISTSRQWDAEITKLDAPADWKGTCVC